MASILLCASGEEEMSRIRVGIAKIPKMDHVDGEDVGNLTVTQYPCGTYAPNSHFCDAFVSEEQMRQPSTWRSEPLSSMLE